MNHQPASKFVVLPKNSVGLYAESVGHANLPENILASLSEDVTFRLRETINNALKFMRHSKRRYLATDDFNKALKWSNSPTVYGQGGVDVPSFRSFNFKDSTISFTEDKDTNLRETAFDSTLPADPGEVSIKAQWLVFEGHNCSGGKQSKEEIPNREELEEPFASYLEQIILSVFGTNLNARKVALDNIRTSGKLQSILPYMVTFLASQVKSCSGSEGLKTIVTGVLLIVHSLVENALLFLVPYVLQLVKLLLFIITDENLPVEFWDSKLTAARILTQLCRRHMSTMNYLPHHLLKAYQETVADETKPLASIYGAAFGISCLGAEPAHQIVYPILLKRIESIKESISYSKDLNLVKESLVTYALFQRISLFLLRTAILSPANSTVNKTGRSSGSNTVVSTGLLSSHKYLSIYNEVFDYFTEGLIAHTQCLNAPGTNPRSIFNPFKAANTKQTNLKQGNSPGLLNQDRLKSELAANIGGLKTGRVAKPAFIKEVSTSSHIKMSLQTSIGVVGSDFRWRKRKFSKDVNVFGAEDNNDKSDGPTQIKRPKPSISKTKTSSEVRRKNGGEAEIELSRLSKKTRLRLIDLAKIPATVAILI
ncbi:TAF6-like RNA polymerase II p300/CBP-associated factor-associated factor 65 kDa subunit 6L [Rhopilema esculentum]|uniref:TAF6-like RNA polymerase II p300/CBP-associated factor-associated factor 65 kDa subunit 6L n=1 Tax=Rhopilema esculentum TaxID=499914 RepID=UPI0031E1DC98